MKIKKSFITNSSSSTFIIVWPRKITTIEDVEEFIDKKYAKTVFNDAISSRAMSKNAPDTLISICKELEDDVLNFGSGYERMMTNFCRRENITKEKLNQNSEWYRTFIDKLQTKKRELAYEKTKQFLEGVLNDNYIYILSYSDDNEYSAEMEHGNIFSNLKYIRINQH